MLAQGGAGAAGAGAAGASSGGGGAAGNAGSGGGPIDCAAATTPPDAACGDLAWSKSATVSRLRNHHTTHALTTPAGAFLYVLGGYDAKGGTQKLVDRAPIAEDGSLGAFVDDTPLPLPLAGHVSAVVGKAFVVAGGMSSGNSAATYVAPRNDDGTIGAWVKGNPLPHPRMHGGAFVSGNDVYVMGGFSGNSVWNDIVRATLQSDGTLSDWAPAGTLPGPRSHFTVTLLDGYAYFTGGLDKSALTDPPNLKVVTRAHLLSDGTLGEWTDLTPLPGGLATHAAFFYGGHLYVGGGIDDAPMQSKVIYRAALAADHTIGAWEKAAELPTARSHVHQFPVLNGHVYSVAGSIDFNLNSTAEIALGAFGP